jgi:hypothetical protein
MLGAKNGQTTTSVGPRPRAPGVNDERNYPHCFAGCGGGSVIDFYVDWKGYGFTAAVGELAGMLL